MYVKVKYLMPIRKAAGKSEENFELESNITVTDLIKELVKRYGEDFKNFMVSPESEELTTEKISVGIQREGLIGTKMIELLDGFDTFLKDRDCVLLFSPQA